LTHTVDLLYLILWKKRFKFICHQKANTSNCFRHAS